MFLYTMLFNFVCDILYRSLITEMCFTIVMLYMSMDMILRTFFYQLRINYQIVYILIIQLHKVAFITAKRWTKVYKYCLYCYVENIQHLVFQYFVCSTIVCDSLVEYLNVQVFVFTSYIFVVDKLNAFIF